MAQGEASSIPTEQVSFRSGRYALQSGKIEGGIAEYVLSVLPQDLQKVMAGVARQELNSQVRIGNNPSQILVDGRPTTVRAIDHATRVISIRFADTRMLVTAISEAHRLLQAVTRIESPAKNSIVARKNFHLWLNGKDLGLMPGALSKLAPGTLDARSVLRVVGPLVNYGRKLYWNPIGRAKVMTFKQRTNVSTGRSRFVYDTALQPRFRPLRDKTLRRMANQFDGDKARRLSQLRQSNPGSVEGSNQIVKRVLRRNRLFTGLFINDGWVSYGPARSWGKNSKDDRVPSISVQLARKGAAGIAAAL